MSALPRASLSPLDALLARVDRPRRAGEGFRAKCPSCGGNGLKLSIGETSTGAVLLHCFGGCAPAEVLAAVGLQLGDLFPERLRPMTDAERRDARERTRMAQWQAALEVLCKEAAIVYLAQQQLVRWQFLSEDDDMRLKAAEERIANARDVLCPPPARFRPEVRNG